MYTSFLLQNNLCILLTRKLQYSKTDFKRCLKDFWDTKMKMSQKYKFKSLKKSLTTLIKSKKSKMI